MKNTKIIFTLILAAFSFTLTLTSCQKDSTDDLIESEQLTQDELQFRANNPSNQPAANCYRAHIIVDEGCDGTSTGWNDYNSSYTVCNQILAEQIAYYNSLPNVCITVPSTSCSQTDRDCNQ